MARPPPTAFSRCSRATKASGSSWPSAWPNTAAVRPGADGCWLPECAYRPRGPWAPWPTAPRSGVRRGIEEHVGDAGFGFFFVDAHLAAAGRPLGCLRRSAGRPPRGTRQHRAGSTSRLAYAVSGLPGRPVTRRPAGRRVTFATCGPRCRYGADSGLPGRRSVSRISQNSLARWPQTLASDRRPMSTWGQSSPYDPAAAGTSARGHAVHFAELLGQLAATESPGPRRRDRGAVRYRIIWALVVRGARLRRRRVPRATPPARGPASDRLRSSAPAPAPVCHPSSRGDLGRERRLLDVARLETAWTWERIWPLEQAFWDVAGDALARPGGAASPRSGGALAPAHPVVRLAIHHLDRRGGGLCRSAVSPSIATRPSSWSPPDPGSEQSPRRRHNAGRGARAARPSVPRRAAGRGRGAQRLPLSSSWVSMHPSGSPSASTCISR